MGTRRRGTRAAATRFATRTHRALGLGTGLAGDDSGWGDRRGGAGVTFIGLTAGDAGDGRLERAVRTYNAASSPAPTAFLVPWAGTIRGAQDRCLAAGVTVGF